MIFQTKKVEENWSFEEIKIIRELAYQQAKKSGKLKQVCFSWIFKHYLLNLLDK